MITKAIITNNDFIISQTVNPIYEGDITVNCNAILMAFMNGSIEDITGGTLYATGCVGPTEVSMIITADIKKVVLSREPQDSEELCAIELLKEHSIEVVFNSNIIMGD